MIGDDLSGTSDTTLVLGISRYHHDALAEVYRRHAGPVFGLARRLLVDVGLAEEVVQEVFLGLWMQPDKFDPDRGSLRAYLLSYCHGRSIDVIRSETARRTRQNRDLREAAESGYDLEHEVWDLTVAAQVKGALRGLPDSERQPIELAYLDGYTYREVAQLLDQPEGTIKSRVRNGLRRMRDDLDDADINPHRGDR